MSIGKLDRLSLSAHNNQTPLKIAAGCLLVAGIGLVAAALLTGVGDAGRLVGGLSGHRWTVLVAGAGTLGITLIGSLAGRYLINRVIVDDVHQYFGGVQNNKPHGQGKLYRTDGKLEYDGGFNDGVYHGQGKVYNDGILECEGGLDNGRMSGKGTFIDAYKNQFEGIWKDGVPDGEFTVRYAGRAVYVGKLNNDLKPDGQGTFTDPDRIKYVGAFEKGMLHGQGTFTFLDGAIYKGEVYENKLHGKGTYIDARKITYDGQWEKGKRHGTGKLTDKEGKVYKEGQWEGDKFVQDTINMQTVSSGENPTPDEDGDVFYDADEPLYPEFGSTDVVETLSFEDEFFDAQ